MATNGRLAVSVLTAALASGALLAAVPQTVAAQRANASNARLMTLRPQLGLDQDHGFTLANFHGDNLNQVHAHFQQTYQGVKVWGGQAISHVDAEGTELPLTNALLTNIRINTRPSLEATEALAAAHADLNPQGAFSLDPTVELVIMPTTTTVRRAASRHISDADLNATDVERQVVRYTLAYHVHTELENALDGIRQTDYMINAHTGAIISKWDDLHTSAAVGTGNSQYSGTVSLNTNSVSGGFEMRDMTRGSGGTFGNNIVTNAAHASTSSTATGSIYTNSSNTWGDSSNYISGGSTTNANGQTAAVDAMFGMMTSWDFYKNVLGRNGINGSGQATYSRVHIGTSYDNAFWSDGCFCMTYGDGSSFTVLTSIDVAGHEMTHGVIANSVPGGLTYSGEAGGLNESNSDIFGTMIEYYDLGGGMAAQSTTVPATGGNFTIGEQLNATPLRYMYKPSLDGSSPDVWSSTVGNLDVHYSSGPGNRAFYFLAQGATTSGNTSTTLLPSGMSGVGNDHAARIHYRATTTYYTSNETYAQARAAHISAAKDLYGAGSAEEQAVWNSFHGINVGAAWTSTVPTAPSITGQPANASVQVGTSATFTVTASGSATLAYQWRKNATNISGATSASYTTPATVIGDSGSTFSVVVSNSVGSATSSNATLTVTSTPPPPPGNNEVEPNDSLATANSVTVSGTTMNGKMGSSSDIDYYTCQLGAGRTITATMTPNSSSDYDLYVYNSNGTLIGSSELGTGAVDSVSVKNTGTSTFKRYAKVIYYAGATGAAGTYTLKLTF